VKIVHDRERCQVHGQCTIAAPDVFHFDDEGELVVDETPPEWLRADAEAAMDVCPERAIEVLDE
jgi:ferredoxin